MQGESEIQKTARQISDLDTKLQANRNKIEELRHSCADDETMLYNLSKKMISLMSPFTYEKNENPIGISEENGTVTYANKNELNATLGPVVINFQGASIRQKVIDFATRMPSVLEDNIQSYLITSGYASGTAGQLTGVIRRYLLSKGWIFEAGGRLVRPKEFKLDLATATPQEKELLLEQL